MNQRLFNKDMNLRKIHSISKTNEKKFSFSDKTKNTIKSLNEVEYFLNNINNFKKYLYLYKYFNK
jgi:hypothetical protein